MDLRAQQSQEPAPEEDVLGAPFRAERMLRNLLSHLDGMVFRCGSDEGARFEYVSEGCEQLTGYRVAHLQGRSMTDLLHAEDRMVRQQAVSSAVVTGERYTVQYRMVARDGGVRWVSERGMAVFDGGRDLPALEGVVEDDTAVASVQLVVTVGQ